MLFDRCLTCSGRRSWNHSKVSHSTACCWAVFWIVCRNSGTLTDATILLVDLRGWARIEANAIPHIRNCNCGAKAASMPGHASCLQGIRNTIAAHCKSCLYGLRWSSPKKRYTTLPAAAAHAYGRREPPWRCVKPFRSARLGLRCTRSCKLIPAREWAITPNFAPGSGLGM